MYKVLQQNQFRITKNTAFSEVIRACSVVKRRGQRGTWLIPEMIAAYEELHRLGVAHSVEAWRDDKLVGGLYGVRMHNIFFGESMFSRETNASKAAFITFVQEFKNEGGVLIDCQVHTEHLESLGASFIARDIFLQTLRQQIG
jgi:leucyl/phenylalanyl-tRNA---protein transferase